MVAKFHVGQMIKAVIDEPNKAKKIDILAGFDTPAVRELLAINSGDRPLLVTGIPTHAPSNHEYGVADAKLVSSYKLFASFRIPGSRQDIIDARFSQLLSALSAEESSILIAAVMKKLDLGLSPQEINSALNDCVSIPVLKTPPAPATPPKQKPAEPKIEQKPTQEAAPAAEVKPVDDQKKDADKVSS